MSRVLVDSGVEWLGKIPSSWSICRVKNNFSFHKIIAKEKSANYDRISLTLNGVIKRDKDDSNGLQPDNYDGYQIAYKNDLIFKLIDLENVNTSRIGKSEYEGITSPAYIILTDKCNTKYSLYYFLNMWYQEIFNNIGGDGVRSAINKDELLKVPYINIGLEEQKRIADFLEKQCKKIDQAIQDNKKEVELLIELNEQIILNEIDKYNKIKLKYILKDEKSMRVGPFGTQLTNRDYVDDGYWVYNQRVVLDSNYITNDTFITKNKYDEMQPFRVEAGDILLTTRGTIGKISIVPETYKEGILHPCIIKFKVKNYDEKLLRYIFNETNYIKEQLQIMSNSTTIDVVYSYNLREVLLPNIDYIEQKKITDRLNTKCSKLKNIIEYRKQIIDKLEEYKKSLIYECVTGKREV